MEMQAFGKAYAGAVAFAFAPDLPAAYYSWGVAPAKHADLVAAEAELKDANQRGPHWADPLKAWGDVLVKQGDTKDACAKYDEALKYALNWKELKEVREVLAKTRVDRAGRTRRYGSSADYALTRSSSPGKNSQGIILHQARGSANDAWIA
jgi:tetratricopeptide (TPR) repeat protein